MTAELTLEGCCHAAEELAALGYEAESAVLWEHALTLLASAEPTVADTAKELIAERRKLDPQTWRQRTRDLVGDALARTPRLRPRAWRAAGITLFALTCVIFFVRLRSPCVYSSADRSPENAAQRAVDDDLQSEWLLPDRTLGFLDLALARRKRVKQVTLINGRNAPFHDRGVHRARIVVYDDDREVDSAEVTFPNAAGEPQVRTVALARKRGTRVRIDVLEHAGLGAALAEVDID